MRQIHAVDTQHFRKYKSQRHHMQHSHLIATGGLFSYSPNHGLWYQFPQRSRATGALGVRPHVRHLAGGKAWSLQETGQEVWGAEIITVNSFIVTFSL